MDIMNLFKKKSEKTTFKKWIDLPSMTNSSQSNSDFIKKYKIKSDVIITINGRVGKITQVRNDMLTYKFLDDETPHRDSGAIYFNEFNEYKVKLDTIPLTDDEFISYNDFEDAIRSGNYDKIVLGIENHGITDNILKQLKFASSMGKLDSIKAFMEYGDLINTKFAFDIFLSAVKNGHISIVELFLKNGLDPSINDNKALYYSTKYEKIQRLLIQNPHVINSLIEQNLFELLPKDIRDNFLF